MEESRPKNRGAHAMAVRTFCSSPLWASTPICAFMPGMCGRYRIKDSDLTRENILRLYGIDLGNLTRRYNVAPSQEMPVVALDDAGAPRAASMRWGLVPFWDKAAKPKFASINARSEDALAKPMFRQSVQQRRCLVPADGFYEWQQLPTGGKQPYDIQLKDGRPFFFAGIYERATELRPETFLLFTTRPNDLMQPFHDRMPVILRDEDLPRWLNAEPITPAEFAALTVPHPADDMAARPISSLVNSPRNDGPEVLFGQEELF